MTIEKGSRIGGRYVVREVHRGGMGMVYIAEDEAKGHRYAIKTVADEFLKNPTVLERFRTEAETWLSIEPHPNVVQAHAFRVFGGRPLLFLEYVDGVPLSRLLDLHVPVHIPQAVRWSREVAAAMSHVHGCCTAGGRACVVHRDLKPGNLMIRRDGSLSLMDFGLARTEADLLHVTREGALLGSPFYEAPEQIRDPRSVDHRADIYSFGIILYEMLQGDRLFDAESLPNLIYKILNDPPPDPKKLRPDVPEALRVLISGCLAKDPRERPACFHTIGATLSDIAKEVEVTPPPADRYRRCDSCRIWIPHTFECCLLSQEDDILQGLHEIDPDEDSVDWSPFAAS